MAAADLVAKTGYQHPHGPLAHGVSLQGYQLSRLAVDAVGSETARGRAGGEDEMTLRVQTEGTGYRLGRHVRDGRQPPGGGVDGEARDTVVTPVGNLQEFPRRRDLNLGAGGPAGVTLGQGYYGLKNR